ncbi:uncharacterized protein LOC128560033 [Nycticebus coucang]|uniref:uncharacterized protein LOC128560033 n=1 Tax=Nycticebus coucang TaxID=9470 RepID=UPI00234C1E98|nr:uncharacterized protein LOC128560033 [Nycticebus coucang]XP_053409473.1 uncharacterized protein LOC128560033 [Nycticebus coucang]
MAVSVFPLPHGDPERWVSGVGRGRGGLVSQSVPDVVCRTRRNWLAMTSSCSSGWGQSRRGRLLQRQRGRSDDGDRCCSGWYGTQAVAKGIARFFPIFSCPCASKGSLTTRMTNVADKEKIVGRIAATTHLWQGPGLSGLFVILEARKMFIDVFT